MEFHREQVAESEPEHPHGNDREDHGHFHIGRGAQCVRQCEGQRPDRHNAGGMVQDDVICVHCSLIGEVVDRKDERQGKDHDQVGRDQAQILDAHHMFGIVLHLLKIAGADALGADREECESEGHSRQDREVCDIVADCVCRE